MIQRLEFAVVPTEELEAGAGVIEVADAEEADFPTFEEWLKLNSGRMIGGSDVSIYL